MNILVTGAEGFVGPYLVKELEKQGHSVFPSAKDPQAGFITLDLLKPQTIKQTLQKSQPEAIYHLAAQSSTPVSFQDPVSTFQVNILGTIFLYEQIRLQNLKPRIFYIGSSEEFGQVEAKDIPLSENSPFRPVSPYGSSRVAMHYINFQYHKAFGLPIIHLRAFTHFGPGQRLGFLASDFASQIAKIELGAQSGVIKVGNLKVIRDYTDVRDMTRAYALALTKCAPGESYNICSGAQTTLKDILETLLSFSTIKPKIVVSSDLVRKVETPIFVGSFTKFHQLTGWQPQIPLSQTLKDVLDWWRQYFKNNPPT